ncbi:MAG: UDP-N-acetylglucosamine pyrophosphorylase [Candidatus Marinimicrobia bacterium]|nr:UDP-N-acetylglucosamine pyrophosphorylase [Candidatus Neomarinimicrobiota bacterium]
MNNNKLSVVIMAAGRGTRMKSELPKVLHHLSGETLLNHVITTAEKLTPENIITVVGHEAQMVQDSVNKSDILFSIQKDQKGTGHAVMQTQNHLENFDGNTLVLSGDVPLISKNTLHSLILKHESNNYDATMLTAEINDPSGYGRVIRDNKNNLKRVCEHKDCNEKELKINEINSGIYVFKNKLLFDLLPKLDNDNAQSEYYLPDILTLIVNLNGNVGLKRTNDFTEIQGINTFKQLSELEKEYKK